MRLLVVCEPQPHGGQLLDSLAGVLPSVSELIPVWDADGFEEQLARASSIDCVITGFSLDWADGLGVIKSIRHRVPSLPIIMISAINGEDIVAAGFRDGLNDFLRPTQLDRLPDTLHTLLPGWQPVSERAPMGVYVQLQRVNDRLETLYSVVSDYAYSFVIESDGTIWNEWRSDGLRKLSGYSIREFEELGWREIVHPDDHDLITSRSDRLREGESVVTEYRLIHRGGGIRWVRDHAWPIWSDEEGRYTRFIGSAQDITIERLTEVGLMRQLRVLELIATGAPFDDVLEATIDLIDLPGYMTSCAIHVLDRSKNVLRRIYSRKMPVALRQSLEEVPMVAGAGWDATALLNEEVVISPDIAEDQRWPEWSRTVGSSSQYSVVSVPMIGTQGQSLGTLSLYERRSREPGATRVERAKIASQLISVALEKHSSEQALRLAELRYRRLAEGIPAVTFICEANHLMPFSYLSPQSEYILGCSPSDLLQRQATLYELIMPDDIAPMRSAVAHAVKHRTPLRTVFRRELDDGHVRWLECSAVYVPEEDDHPASWQGILFDVSDRFAAQQALRESQLRYRSLFEHNPHAVMTINRRGRFQHVNPATERMTGYAVQDMVNRPLTSILVAGELERVWYHFKRARSGDAQQFETKIFRKNGGRITINVTAIPVIIDERVVAVSVVAEDITERKMIEQKLSFQAFHDPLTRLPNRVLFEQHLIRNLQTMHHLGQSLAVLFIDLDNFKMVNDSLGHDAGDEYLKIVADRLDRCVEKGDLVARFGGDEFTILLVYPASDLNRPTRVAERIGKMLAEPVHLNGNELTTQPSIGIAIHDATSGGVQDLLRRADIALYQAKRRGAGTIYAVFQPDMHQQIIERLEIERDLRRALQRNELVVHYQPIIDLNTGKIAWLEGLVRWNHPERGLLGPGAFLPVAEETGQIAEIDAWVMREACHMVARWNQIHSNGSRIRVGVNISARDFREGDLVQRVHQTLDETSCDPSWLMLEIVESTMMQDFAIAFDVLVELRETGVGFSIDDFGTGYSSLAYLHRLPLDTLKIDRSFIDGLGGDPEDEAIVRTIISLASALKLDVIAEGIETKEQLERARELGCHRAQGFFIAKPMPFTEIVKLLDRASSSSEFPLSHSS